MNYFDDENKIIEWLQEVECSSVCFPIENDELVAIFDAIYNEEQWKLWKNSSGKADPPPDFYCDKLKLMMDVMRVDDHAFKNKKGKIVNPTNARESQKQRELRESGILDMFPNAENIFINAVTDLPTDQDHNYKFYKNNFVRTIEEHKRKISLYRQNHPDFKTIFLICDESSAYMMRLDGVENESEVKCGYCHYWFTDKAFLSAFLGSAIDYVIWFTPFKLVRLVDGSIIDLPRVVVFDAKSKYAHINSYNTEKMFSVEK